MNFRDFFTINNWWGKIIGALFGYLTGGAFGAFIGILIGNFFDKGLAKHFANPHLLYHSEKRQDVQKVFFDATFSVMGHIAKADGRVSEQEIKMAQLLMQEMRLNKEQIELGKQLFNEGKKSHFNLHLVLTQLQKMCRDNRDLLKLFVEIQYRAAQVDGLSSKKIKALDSVFSYLGFAPLHQQYRFYEDFSNSSYQNYEESYSQKQQQYEQEYSSKKQSQHSQQEKQHYYHYRPRTSQADKLSQAYALLEVTNESTKQEVKRAYRQLLSRNHPDKLIAQGLPEAMIKIANDKTHKIRQAYELICESKGW